MNCPECNSVNITEKEKNSFRCNNCHLLFGITDKKKKTDCVGTVYSS